MVKDHGTYFQLQSLWQAFTPEAGVQGSCHFFGMEVVYTVHPVVVVRPGGVVLYSVIFSLIFICLGGRV